MARLAWLSQQPRTSGRPVHAKLNPPQCETNVTSRFHCVPSDVPTRALLTNATQPPRVTPLKRSKLVLVLRSLSNIDRLSTRARDRQGSVSGNPKNQTYPGGCHTTAPGMMPGASYQLPRGGET